MQHSPETACASDRLGVQRRNLAVMDRRTFVSSAVSDELPNAIVVPEPIDMVSTTRRPFTVPLRRVRRAVAAIDERPEPGEVVVIVGTGHPPARSPPSHSDPCG